MYRLFGLMHVLKIKPTITIIQLHVKKHEYCSRITVSNRKNPKAAGVIIFTQRRCSAPFRRGIHFKHPKEYV